MAHINLLPWRAERRKLREREFYGQLGMAFVAGIIVVIAWAFWMGQRIDNQNARNAYLKDQIHQVQAKIDKIKDLKKVRSQLLARKRIIEKLQSNRSQMVHLFDELVKTIPDSVRLTSLKQNGKTLKLAGVAQSNASVAEYMRNLEASPWLGPADLEKTVNHHDGSRMPYSFSLTLQLSKPSAKQIKAAEEKDGSAPASSASVAHAGSVAAAAQVLSITPTHDDDSGTALASAAKAGQADTAGSAEASAPGDTAKGGK